MLCDATGFKRIIIACGYTDLSWLLWSGTTSIWIHLRKMSCFCFAGERATGSNVLYGRGMDFSCCIKGWKMEDSSGPGLSRRLPVSRKNSSICF